MTREGMIKRCVDLSEAAVPALHERYLHTLDDQTLAERLTILQSQATRILPSRGERLDWRECVQRRQILSRVHGCQAVA